MKFNYFQLFPTLSLCIALFFNSYSSNAQCTGNIILSTQAEVNAFSCDSVFGNLFIGTHAYWSAEITDLTPLSGLTYVQGDLTIKNVSKPKDTVFYGFENLNYVGKNFILLRNFFLQNLDPFKNLSTIGSDLIITSNYYLQNIDSLMGLSHIEGNITILGNDKLQNIDGLAGLDSIHGKFVCGYNLKMKNIDGISNVTYIKDGFEIGENPNLQNIDGLSQVTRMDGPIHLFRNNKLENFNSLVNIREFNKEIWVYSHNSLIECCGLFYPLFTTTQTVLIDYNGAACTKNEILINGPCDPISPDSLIELLVDMGSLNSGQANALTTKINKCHLNPLENQLEDFAENTFIAQKQATAILGIATNDCSGARTGAFPSIVELGRAYPNPAFSSTIIPFSLSQDENISLNIYDAQGRLVLPVLKERKLAGKHEIKVNLRSLPVGTYFYQIRGNSFLQSNTLIIRH